MTKPDMSCKPGTPYFMTILLCAFYGLIVSVLTLLILCFLVNAEIIAENLVFPMAAGMAGLGALTASMCASSKLRSKRLMTGMLAGILFYVMLLFISMLSPAGAPNMKSALVVMITVLIGSFLGIALSGNVKKRR
ncbi:MAG: TIGR04086 family membrane protein [Bacillota bacterium]|nr:TIGR04086 family membrane protein [Bacillota bacterium]